MKLMLILAGACLLSGVAQAGAPKAVAGPDQVVNPGAIVTLNGSGSSDPDGDPLTFSWTLRQKPAGSSARLTGTASVMPQFTADVLGKYVIDLVVSDGQNPGSVSTVMVATVEANTAPVANAGPDRGADTGEDVTLDGSGSTDVDGDELLFNWVFESLPAGSAAQLFTPGSVRATFAPDLAGAYVIRLEVDDARGGVSTDSVVISTLAGNQPPVANAGPDQAVSGGSLVQLDGRGSSDPDGQPLSFHWSFVARPAGSGAAIAGPGSVAPTFLADRPGDYVLQLIVNDGQADSAADTVLVTSNNTPPVANAGPDQAATAGDRVHLDGNGSSDANGDALAFSWSFVSRPAASNATLDDALMPFPGFTADAAGLYVLQLIVNDGVVDSIPDTVAVNVEPQPNADPVASRDEFVIDFGSSLLIDALANDSDPDGDPLTLASVTTPVNGTATLENGRIRYVPNTGFSGLDIFNYTVSDGRGGSDTAGIEVRIRPAPGTVTVTAPDAQAGELGPDVGSFLVSRTGPTDEPLTVSFGLLGTATNGVDYQALPTSVTIPAGAASTSLQVTPIPDGLAEGAESVLLHLSPGANYLVGTPGLASVSIADSVAVSIEATDNSASESTLDPAAFVISRTGDLGRSLLISVSFGGTANRLNIVDATVTNIVGGSLVTIPAGAASITLAVTPVRDNRVEGVEDLIVTIVPAASYSVGTPASASITIADDPPVVTLEATDAFASETGPDTGSFVVRRTGGDLTGSIVVRCSFTGGTAAGGLDFTPGGCGFTLAANASEATMVITPVADTRVEGSETVTAVLTASLIAAYQLGTPGQATITISD